MENFLPLSKSFLEDVEKCPWRAKRIKVDKIRSTTTVGARRGIAFHNWSAKIRKGEIGFDDALRAMEKAVPPEDLEEVQELVRLAITTDPVELSPSERKSMKIEHYFMVTEDGKITRRRDQAIVTGYLDRIFRRDNGVVVVDDLKSDRMMYDSINERFCYVAAAKAMYPDATEIHFARQYVRMGIYATWRFLFSDNDKVMDEFYPDNPGAISYRTGEVYIFHWLRLKRSHIAKLPPEPRPGPHCENYYGEPCQFFGNECPLAEDVPALVAAVAPQADGNQSSYALLQKILTPGNVVSKEDIATAKAGVLQLEGFVKTVNEAIASWSKEHGAFQVGDTTYGWFDTEEYECDKVFALSEMFNAGMPMEDMVKVVNISKSSLEKMSKRKYGDFRDALLAMAITTKRSKPKFGVIKHPEEEAS